MQSMFVDDEKPLSSASETTPTTPLLTLLSRSSGGSPDSAKSESSKASSTLEPHYRESNAESILNFQKNVVNISGRVFTDCANLLPLGLSSLMENYEDEKNRVGKDLSSRAVCLISNAMIGTAKDTNLQLVGYSEAQVCFVQTERGIVMATVKHNLCDATTKVGYEQCMSPVVVGGLFSFDFPDRNLTGWNSDNLTDADAFNFDAEEDDEKTPTWKYGEESVLIPLNRYKSDQSIANVLEKIASNQVLPFETIDTDFELEQGMEVGILAYSCGGAIAEKMHLGLKDGNTMCDVPPPYKPRPRDAFFAIGKIKYVGDKYITYDVNTVHGFSGGAVVLLSENEDDHMKLIALHAGYLEERRANFGFLVSHKIKEYEDEDEDSADADPQEPDSFSTELQTTSKVFASLCAIL